MRYDYTALKDSEVCFVLENKEQITVKEVNNELQLHCDGSFRIKPKASNSITIIVERP